MTGLGYFCWVGGSVEVSISEKVGTRGKTEYVIILTQIRTTEHTNLKKMQNGGAMIFGCGGGWISNLGGIRTGQNWMRHGLSITWNNSTQINSVKNFKWRTSDFWRIELAPQGKRVKNWRRHNLSFVRNHLSTDEFSSEIQNGGARISWCEWWGYS